jgi:hypothetical protein
MSILEIRQEMIELIKNEDDNSLKGLYHLIKSYKNQRQLDKMIEEGEDDIDAGRTYGLKEARKLID